MKSTREKVSYCIGLETGRNLRRQFNDMDIDLLKKGKHNAIIIDLSNIIQPQNIAEFIF